MLNRVGNIAVIASEGRNPKSGWYPERLPRLLHFVRNDEQEGVNMYGRQPAIYIMANKRNGTLYTGVTSNLIQRVYQHKQLELRGFTRKYECKHLVYYEQYEDMLAAISREKQIKAGSRKKKLTLIENINPDWKDLYATLI